MRGSSISPRAPRRRLVVCILVLLGLGRIVALYHRSPILYHIHSHIRCLDLRDGDATEPKDARDDGDVTIEDTVGPTAAGATIIAPPVQDPISWSVILHTKPIWGGDSAAHDMARSTLCSRYG
jgi:hypothetical protein